MAALAGSVLVESLGCWLFMSRRRCLLMTAALAKWYKARFSCCRAGKSSLVWIRCFACIISQDHPAAAKHNEAIAACQPRVTAERSQRAMRPRAARWSDLARPVHDIMPIRQHDFLVFVSHSVDHEPSLMQGSSHLDEWTIDKAAICNTIFARSPQECRGHLSANLSLAGSGQRLLSIPCSDHAMHSKSLAAEILSAMCKDNVCT